MANARRRKARKSRRVIGPASRFKPTPETLAKLRPHPLELLLAKGPEAGGIDADQLQCAEEIVDAYQAVTRGLGIASHDWEKISCGRHGGEISLREEQLSAIWFAWAAELIRCALFKPSTVAELLHCPTLDPDLVPRLVRALDLWGKVRQGLFRAAREVATIRSNEP